LSPSSLSSITAVQMWIISYILNIISLLMGRYELNYFIFTPHQYFNALQSRFLIAIHQKGRFKSSNKLVISHSHIPHSTPCLPPKILHNLCFPFLLGITVIPRETKEIACAKFWGQTRCIMGDVEMAISNSSWTILSKGERYNEVNPM